MSAPKYSQPNVGSGDALATLPPTAAYLVGDRCRSLAHAQLHEGVDININTIVVIPRSVGVEVLEIGMGIYDNRIRIRSHGGGGEEGWTNVISDRMNQPLLSINMDGAEPALPAPMLMLWSPPTDAFRVGDICTTLNNLAIRETEELDSTLVKKMTACIPVQVLNIGVSNIGRRVKIRTLTWNGPVEGWVSVCKENDEALTEPVAGHGFLLTASRQASDPKAMQKGPPAKRGREAHVDENLPAPRRRRYWF